MLTRIRTRLCPAHYCFRLLVALDRVTRRLKPSRGQEVVVGNLLRVFARIEQISLRKQVIIVFERAERITKYLLSGVGF